MTWIAKFESRIFRTLWSSSLVLRVRKRESPVPRPHLRSLTTLVFDPNQEGTCRHVCRYPLMRCKVLHTPQHLLPSQMATSVYSLDLGTCLWVMASGRLTWKQVTIIWAGTSMVQDTWNIVNKRSVVTRGAYPLTHSLLHGHGCIQTRDRWVPLKYNLSPVAG